MKSRLFAAIICISASLFLSVGSEMYITRKSVELTAALDKSLHAENGSSEMYAAALAAYDGWNGCKTLFGSFLKHSDADVLERAYSLIREYADAEDVDELKETIEECKISLKVISDGERLRAENIF